MKKIKPILVIMLLYGVAISIAIIAQAPSISWTNHEVATLPGAIDIAIGDIDDDGYNDIIGVGRNKTLGYVAWYKNNSDYTAWTEYKIYEIPGNRMVEVADFDGDNDLDVCVSNYDNHRIDIYENPADPTSVPWTRHAVTTTHVSPGYLIWIYDFDNDTDMDICASSPFDDDILWFRNEGSYSFTAFIVEGGLSGARGITIGDFDDDGDMDITGGSSSSTVYWYENDLEHGVNSSWNQTLITNGVVDEPTGQCSGDIDDDGDVDLVVKNLANGKLYWFENTAGDGSAWSSNLIEDSIMGTAYTVTTGDLDDDSDLDIGLINLSGTGFIWMENLNGAGTSWEGHYVSSWQNQSRDIDFLDYQNDGILDVLGTAYYDDKIWWFESNLTASGEEEDPPTPPTGLTATAFGSTQIDLSWTKGTNATHTYIEWNTEQIWDRGKGIEVCNITLSGYSHTPLTPNTNYRYQAWSYDSNSNLWNDTYASVNQTTGYGSLDAPQFISINNLPSGSFVYDGTPVFKWTVIEDAMQYHLQIDDDSDFSSLVVNLTDINEAHYPPRYSSNDTVVTFELPVANYLSADYYYFRVRAYI